MVGVSRRILLLAMAIPSIALGQVRIDVDGIAGTAGDELTLSVALSVSGTPVVATQNQLHFPHGTSVVSCRANEEIGKDATLFTYLPQGCQRGVDCSSVRVLVFSLTDSNPIPDGSLLYTCKVRIHADATPGRSEIACDDTLASTADAEALPADCPAAAVVVADVTDVSIVVGGATAAPAQRAVVDVAIEHQSEPIATQNDLRFPAGTRVRSCAMNKALNKSNSRLALLPQGCTPGVDCTTVRALVFSFEDRSVIPTGSTLYSCTVDVDATVPLGSALAVECSNAGASDVDAGKLETDCREGAITVVDPVVSLDFSRASGLAGGRAAVALVANMLRDNIEIFGVETEIRISRELTIAATQNGTPACVAAQPNLAFQQLSYQPAGCIAGLDCTAVRASIRSTDGPISDGATVMRCAFAIPEDAQPGSVAVRHLPGTQRATDGGGNVVGATATDGEVVVRSACTGDCNGDYLVPVSELITGVNVLLDQAPIAACLAFDRNLNGMVTVDELVTGIREALSGCTD